MVALRVTVRMVVAEARLVRVVVGRGRGPYLLLEPRQRDPVDADVAVHPDVPLDGLGVALHQEVGHPRVGPEVPGVAHLEVRMPRGEPFGLVPDALLEDAREEE